MISDPFAQEGYEDAMQGVDRTECPYPDGSDGAQGWLSGWDIATRELERFKSV